MNVKKWIEFRWYLDDIARACMSTWKHDVVNDANT